MLFGSEPKPSTEGSPIPPASATPSLVDTSVIIDGRIADIARAGFAPGKLLIPRFVLAELQLIADSGDAMKRSRGRRGLEMLHGMRESGVDMEIIEYDYDDIKAVDAKLVRLARHLSVNVLTTDYNLNRVASIEGVRVLNINELANAVRPVILPGERMHTRIVQPGKERSQGVGYLADGTMIVVDGGDRLLGQDVEVEITRVFQTVAGKMLFAIIAPGQSLQSTRPQGTDRRGGGRQSRGAGAAVSQPQFAAEGSGSAQAVSPISSKPNSTSRGGSQNGSRRPRHGGRQSSDNHAQPDTTAQTPKKSGQSQAAVQVQPKPAKPAAKPAAAPKNGRRPKRVSPTQRLEDSLLELTKGSQDQNG